LLVSIVGGNITVLEGVITTFRIMTQYDGTVFSWPVHPWSFAISDFKQYKMVRAISFSFVKIIIIVCNSTFQHISTSKSNIVLCLFPSTTVMALENIDSLGAILLLAAFNNVSLSLLNPPDWSRMNVTPYAYHLPSSSPSHLICHVIVGPLQACRS